MVPIKRDDFEQTAILWYPDCWMLNLSYRFFGRIYDLWWWLPHVYWVMVAGRMAWILGRDYLGCPSPLKRLAGLSRPKMRDDYLTLAPKTELLAITRILVATWVFPKMEVYDHMGVSKKNMLHARKKFSCPKCWFNLGVYWHAYSILFMDIPYYLVIRSAMR